MRVIYLGIVYVFLPALLGIPSPMKLSGCPSDARQNPKHLPKVNMGIKIKINKLGG